MWADGKSRNRPYDLLLKTGLHATLGLRTPLLSCKEVIEFGNLLVLLSQATAKDPHDLADNFAPVGHDLIKSLLVDPEQQTVFQGRDRSGPRLGIKQGQFTKEIW